MSVVESHVVTGPARASEASLFDAMFRHRRFVLRVFAGFVLSGLLVIAVLPEQYEASAELIVEDPRAVTIGNLAAPTVQSNVSSERYLADQVKILESAETAQLASRQLGGDPDVQFILEHREIEGSETSNLIRVNFRTDTPTASQAGANALVSAYVEVRERRVAETADAALARVDALGQALEEELAKIDQDIEAFEANGFVRSDLEAKTEQAIVRLNELQQQRSVAEPDSDLRASINAQIDEVIQDFDAWEAALRVEQQDPGLAPLLAKKEATTTELADVTAGRNAIAVEAELAAGGIYLSSLAPLPEEPAGVSWVVILTGFVLLGLAVAGFGARRRDVRDSTITNRMEPEDVLSAPLLADVPELNDEDLRTDPSAEVDSPLVPFQFAATGIDIASSAVGARLLLISSARPGAGTTTVVWNTAMAMANGGSRVVVVDADFVSQSLRRVKGLEPGPGMTEVVEGVADLRDAVHTVRVGESGSVVTLSRGQLDVDAAALFRTKAAADILNELAQTYDMVLVDSPPLLTAACASTLARHADAAVLVVPHGCTVSELEEVAGRLDLIGTPLLGYIYTKAPSANSVHHREHLAG